MKLFNIRSSSTEKNVPHAEQAIEHLGANNPEKILAEAQQLQQELGSADLARTRDILSQLQSLASSLPMTGGTDQRKLGRVTRSVDLAIAQAMHQIRSKHTDEVVDAHSELKSQALQAGLYVTMTVAQKHFFHAIDQKDSYVLTSLTDDGKVSVAEEKKVVSKEELKEKFNVLQYHSLDEKEKQALLQRTFGIDGKDADADLTPDKITAKLEELKDVKSALNDMEAYKAYLILSQTNKGDIRAALGQIAHVHSVFGKTRDKIEAVEAAYMMLQDDPNDPVKLAALKAAREQMQTSIKEGVMNDALTDNAQEKSTMPSLKPALLLLPAAAAIWSGLQKPGGINGGHGLPAIPGAGGPTPQGAAPAGP